MRMRRMLAGIIPPPRRAVATAAARGGNAVPRRDLPPSARTRALRRRLPPTPALPPQPFPGTAAARWISALPLSLGEDLPRDPEEDPHRHLEPIDFAAASRVSGDEFQILEVRLRPNQMLRAESGAMICMTEGVEMETSMGLGGTGGRASGFSSGLTRMMTGQNLMVSDFKYAGDGLRGDGHGTVYLGADFPAKILKFKLSEFPDAKIVCQKGAFLGGSHSVAMEMAYTKSFTSGFFGGEGFILQSLRSTSGGGADTAFLKAYGAVVKRELELGETLRVSSGSLVCMTSTVDYDVATMPGFKNVVFGGEGLFVTTLTGPGIVWLQGTPVDRMVGEIARKVPSGGGIGLGIPIGLGSGGSGESAEDVVRGRDDAEDVEGGGEGGVDNAGVPMTDAAVEADRNATVASSGITPSSSDPDSPESLFGETAYEGDGTLGTANPLLFADEFAQPDADVPEFEEPMVAERQFEDSGTTFSSYDGGDPLGGGDTEAPTSEEEGSGMLGQLWDLFRDFTDDD